MMAPKDTLSRRFLASLLVVFLAFQPTLIAVAQDPPPKKEDPKKQADERIDEVDPELRPRTDGAARTNTDEAAEAVRRRQEAEAWTRPIQNFLRDVSEDPLTYGIPTAAIAVSIYLAYKFSGVTSLVNASKAQLAAARSLQSSVEYIAHANSLARVEAALAQYQQALIVSDKAAFDEWAKTAPSRYVKHIERMRKVLERTNPVPPGSPPGTAPTSTSRALVPRSLFTYGADGKPTGVDFDTVNRNLDDALTRHHQAQQALVTRAKDAGIDLKPTEAPAKMFATGEGMARKIMDPRKLLAELRKFGKEITQAELDALRALGQKPGPISNLSNGEQVTLHRLLDKMGGRNLTAAEQTTCANVVDDIVRNETAFRLVAAEKEGLQQLARLARDGKLTKADALKLTQMVDDVVARTGGTLPSGMNAATVAELGAFQKAAAGKALNALETHALGQLADQLSKGKGSLFGRAWNLGKRGLWRARYVILLVATAAVVYYFYRRANALDQAAVRSAETNERIEQDQEAAARRDLVLNLDALVLMIQMTWADFRSKHRADFDYACPFVFDNKGHRDLVNAAFAKATENLREQAKSPLYNEKGQYSVDLYREFWRLIFEKALDMSDELKVGVDRKTIFGKDLDGRSAMENGDPCLVQQFAEASGGMFEQAMKKVDRLIVIADIFRKITTRPEQRKRLAALVRTEQELRRTGEGDPDTRLSDLEFRVLEEMFNLGEPKR